MRKKKESLSAIAEKKREDEGHLCIATMETADIQQERANNKHDAQT